MLLNRSPDYHELLERGTSYAYMKLQYRPTHFLNYDFRRFISGTERDADMAVVLLLQWDRLSYFEHAIAYHLSSEIKTS